MKGFIQFNGNLVKASTIAAVGKVTKAKDVKFYFNVLFSGGVYSQKFETEDQAKDARDFFIKRLEMELAG